MNAKKSRRRFLFTSPDVLRFNLTMEMENLRYRPTLDPDEIRERLGRLLVPGPLDDRDLQSRIYRLAERFRVYAARSPHGLWAPGLALTREMTGISEIYLPLDEIRRAFDRLFTLSLRFSPFLPASAMLLLDLGYAPKNLEVHGVTVEPLELFAAAHGWFPHDPQRQAAYHRRIRRFFADGTAERIEFYREDLIEREGAAGAAYDVIICNGLLG